jgi:hypothetical protein
MAIDFEHIRHHQRIMITGPLGQEIFGIVTSILSRQHRTFDVISDRETRVDQGPIAFIVLEKPDPALKPHILVMTQVNVADRELFERTADGLPKAGSVIYCTKDPIANEIGSKQRTDVYREEFAGTMARDAAEKLMKRLGVNAQLYKELA